MLPVPAPATVLIMKGMPVYSNDVVGELCTPTGAALLKYFVNEYKPMPTMKIDKIGYGMGHRNFEVANCVRVILGKTQDKNTDTIIKLECNIDDIEKDIIDRDYRDMHREVSPLVQAEDAVLVESSDMTIEQVVEAITKLVK